MLKIVATFINRTYGDVYTREYFCGEDELNDEFIDRVVNRPLVFYFSAYYKYWYLKKIK